MDKKVVSTNRKAFHDYLIFDRFDAGIVLTGTEIKSIRKGMFNLKDSFAKIEEGEVFLYNMHISHYEHGNRFNHEPDRVRKLLLKKQEIMKMLGKIKKENYTKAILVNVYTFIMDKVKKDGVTIVPLELFLSHGFAKIEIGLAKGKKLYDKRETIAKKTVERDIARGVRK